MAKKAPTKKEKDYMASAVELGCILDFCRMPAEIHHPRYLAGAGQRAPHIQGIPICPKHHRTGGYGVAIHAGQATWEAKFGTEAELLKLTYKKLGLL